MSFITNEQNLFIIDIKYTVPLEQIDANIDEHVSFLENMYAQKRFLASGPKVPRVGGIIIAVGEDKAEIEQLLAADPFQQKSLATYNISEFVPRMTAKGLK